jgi:hypothetical protein
VPGDNFRFSFEVISFFDQAKAEVVILSCTKLGVHAVDRFPYFLPDEKNSTGKYFVESSFARNTVFDVYQPARYKVFMNCVCDVIPYSGQEFAGYFHICINKKQNVAFCFHRSGVSSDGSIAIAGK